MSLLSDQLCKCFLCRKFILNIHLEYDIGDILLIAISHRVIEASESIFIVMALCVILKLVDKIFLHL